MSDLIFKDLPDLNDEIIRKIALIDNSVPTEFDPSWQPNESDHEERSKQFKELSQTGFFKVAFTENEVIGFHGIWRGKGPKKNLGMITTLWVHPRFRKRGIGKQLKQMGLEWARTLGLEYLQTSTHSNNTRMMEINSSAGFKPYAVTLRYKL